MKFVWIILFIVSCQSKKLAIVSSYYEMINSKQIDSLNIILDSNFIFSIPFVSSAIEFRDSMAIDEFLYSHRFAAERNQYIEVQNIEEKGDTVIVNVNYSDNMSNYLKINNPTYIIKRKFFVSFMILVVNFERSSI